MTLKDLFMILDFMHFELIGSISINGDNYHHF